MLLTLVALLAAGPLMRLLGNRMEAMLTRLLDVSMRTFLIDEADRSLSPRKKDIGDLLAVLNSGYKRGATRPVSVPRTPSE